MDEATTRRDVTDLLLRYAWAIDSKDWELLRTCFTADCLVVYGNGDSPYPGGARRFRSRDELVDYMERTHQPLDGSLHRMSNIQVTPTDPGAATAISYGDNLLVLRTHPDGPFYESAGHYADELLRQDGLWRITTRQYTRVWAQGNGRVVQPGSRPGPGARDA